VQAVPHYYPPVTEQFNDYAVDGCQLFLLVSVHMANAKPYVAVACVCEQVLIEPDNVASIIRIVDTYTLDPLPVPPAGVKLQPHVPLNAFVSIKSGDVRGAHEVGLLLRKPDGKTGPLQKWPVELRGGEHGANLRIKFVIPDPAMGLYWFDVLWEDEVLTSIPFKLVLRESTPDVDLPSERQKP